MKSKHFVRQHSNIPVILLLSLVSKKCSLWKEFCNSGQVLRLLKAVGKASVSWGRAKPTSLTHQKWGGWQSGGINISNLPTFSQRGFDPFAEVAHSKRSLKLICDVSNFIQWHKSPYKKTWKFRVFCFHCCKMCHPNVTMYKHRIYFKWTLFNRTWFDA